MKYSFLFSLLALTLLGGCRMGQTYHPPCVVTPEEWKGEDVKETPPPLANWWEIFQDPILNSLEIKALDNSPNLYVALERVAEARATAGFYKADLYPQATLAPSYSNSTYLFKLLGISGIPFPPGDKIKQIVRVHQLEYTLPLNLSYELDLWGRIRSQVDSSVYAAIAQVDDFKNTLLTLTTDLASNYFLLRSLDAQIETLEENITSLRHSFELNDSRYQKGLVSLLDVTDSHQILTQTEATLFDIRRQRVTQENAIAALIGIPASCFYLDSNPLFDAPPAIPAGLPCSIVLQRPDLAALERTMASQHALVNSAYASFFPTLTLTGVLGFLSPDFKDFLTWQSRLWTIGGNMFETVFDGGRKTATFQENIARFRQASGTYQQGVINAFQEVEDALAGVEFQTAQSNSLQESYTAATETVKLSKHRYEEGLINYLDVDTSIRNALNVEINYFNAIGQNYISTVHLIKAIGGGWESACLEDGID